MELKGNRIQKRGYFDEDAANRLVAEWKAGGSWEAVETHIREAVEMCISLREKKVTVDRAITHLRTGLLHYDPSKCRVFTFITASVGVLCRVHGTPNINLDQY